MAFVPRWSEPLSAMTSTRGALLSGSWLMTWPISVMNGAMPMVCGQEANTFPGAHVECGQQRRGDQHRAILRHAASGIITCM